MKRFNFKVLSNESSAVHHFVSPMAVCVWVSYACYETTTVLRRDVLEGEREPCVCARAHMCRFVPTENTNETSSAPSRSESRKMCH